MTASDESNRDGEIDRLRADIEQLRILINAELDREGGCNRLLLLRLREAAARE